MTLAGDDRDGERGGFRRLTECQSSCANAGTLTCRQIRSDARRQSVADRELFGL